MIVNNKKKKISEFLELDNNEEELEIKLVISSSIKDINYMFYECTELISIHDN